VQEASLGSSNCQVVGGTHETVDDLLESLQEEDRTDEEDGITF
jgi:hypothetical protein